MKLRHGGSLRWVVFRPSGRYPCRPAMPAPNALEAQVGNQRHLTSIADRDVARGACRAEAGRCDQRACTVLSARYGTIQGIPEYLGIPYTHFRSLASALAMNKEQVEEDREGCRHPDRRIQGDRAASISVAQHPMNACLLCGWGWQARCLGRLRVMVIVMEDQLGIRHRSIPRRSGSYGDTG